MEGGGIRNVEVLVLFKMLLVGVWVAGESGLVCVFSGVVLLGVFASLL